MQKKSYGGPALSNVKFSPAALLAIGRFDSDAVTDCLTSKLADFRVLDALLRSQGLSYPPPWGNLYHLPVCDHFAAVSVRRDLQLARVEEIFDSVPPELNGWL